VEEVLARQGCQMVYFKTENPDLGKFWCLAMKDIGKFYGHSIDFTAISYILWPFWYIFSVLVCCTKKNLANL
jgi:hypothetical protein